ncbi:hypothetical protein AMTRI_Chr04g187990 [Amborella trichopoda]
MPMYLKKLVFKEAYGPVSFSDYSDFHGFDKQLSMSNRPFILSVDSSTSLRPPNRKVDLEKGGGEIFSGALESDTLAYYALVPSHQTHSLKLPKKAELALTI